MAEPRSLYELVEFQLRRDGRRPQGELWKREGPWITISSQIGSGGALIARTIARKLEWKVADWGAREETGSFDRSYEWNPHDELAQLVYVHRLIAAARSAARQGKNVIVERGANWYLDPRHGLRLRLVAPLEARVRRVVEEMKITRHAAADRVLAVDAEQKSFTQAVFRRDIDDAAGYDFVVNTSNWDPEDIVGFTVAALRGRIRNPEGRLDRVAG